MLAHLPDISKIEVQAEDRYKLKVNTKKVSGEEERHYHVWKPICWLWIALCLLQTETWPAEKLFLYIHLFIYLSRDCLR